VQFTVTCSYPLPPLFFLFLFCNSCPFFGSSCFSDFPSWLVPPFLMVHCRPWGGCYWKPAGSVGGMFPCLCAQQSHMVHASSILASPLSSILLRNVNPHFVSHMKGRKSWLTLVQELWRCVLLEVCWLVLIGK